MNRNNQRMTMENQNANPADQNKIALTAKRRRRSKSTPLTLLVLTSVMILSGCMTSSVLREASREPRQKSDAEQTTQNKDTRAEPPDYPKANYLLLPIAIPVDIATSPFQIFFFVLYYSVKC